MVLLKYFYTILKFKIDYHNLRVHLIIENSRMNDSVEIQSPPSKKFKQAEIAIETNSDNKDIEKENKPIDDDSPTVVDGTLIFLITQTGKFPRFILIEISRA